MTDKEMYLRARNHMEAWSVAASLDRHLWDATVREHDRLATLNRELVEALENIVNKSSLRNGGPFYLYDEYGYGLKIHEQASAVLAKVKNET